MHHLLLKPEALVLMRHAESERNSGKVGVFYTAEEKERMADKANHEIAITDNGRMQASETGGALRRTYREFDIVINSGYLRTRQTMEAVLKLFPEPGTILEDIALRERDSGYAYNMTKNEVDAHFPWNDEAWRVSGGFFSRPVGGESLADVVARLDTFFTRLAMICEGKKVLLVGHGRLFVAAQSLLENWTSKDYEKLPKELENAKTLEYYYSKEKGQLIRK